MDRRHVALQRLGVCIPRINLLKHPVQIGYITRKGIDEMVAWHTCQIHADRHDGALLDANFRNFGAQCISQAFDHFWCKAHMEQFCMNGLASLDIRTRLAARSEEHTSELQSLMRISYAV